MNVAGQSSTIVERGAGSGPPLILVHGVGLDHTMWELVVPTLLSHPSGPSQVVRYDLLGHGRETVTEALTFDDLIEQLNTVADQLNTATKQPNTATKQPNTAIEQPDVVGLSLGGAIVRGAAARTPDRFGRVVIANAVFQRSEEQRQGNLDRLKVAADEGMEPVANLAIDRWFTEPWKNAHPDRMAAVHRRLSTTDLDGYLQAYRVFVDGDPAMPEQLCALTNQTLIVTGERDSGSTPAMAQAMAALAPNATAHILPDTGHLPPLEHPDAFSRILIDFLEKPSP